MVRPFILINTNVIRPPVSPIGMEYVGETLGDLIRKGARGAYRNILQKTSAPSQ